MRLVGSQTPMTFPGGEGNDGDPARARARKRERRESGTADVALRPRGLPGVEEILETLRRLSEYAAPCAEPLQLAEPPPGVRRAWPSCCCGRRSPSWRAARARRPRAPLLDAGKRA